MPRKIAIGAFCTDICDSTKRIEKFRESALKQHKIYLETARRRILQNTSKASRAEYQAGDFWVPGDALWGVLYPEPDKTYSESVTASLCRTVYSLAYGLSVANSSPRPAGLEAIKMRSVFLAGPVIREPIFDKLRLYNGTALNACGRLEKFAGPNKIIAGFVSSNNEHFFSNLAQSPVIDANEVKECLIKKPALRQTGYKIRLDTVSSTDQDLIRFVGWRTRQDLRGLGECRVFVTTIELIPRKHNGMEVISQSSGVWDREEVPLLDRQKYRWELYELLKGLTTSKAFEFLKQIYDEGDLEILLPSQDSSLFQLKCRSERFRPRIRKTTASGIRLEKTAVVDFNKSTWCILPTHRVSVSDNEKILIQAYDKKGKKVLCFSRVRENLLNRYEDYADFLDSATPCVEFAFG